MQGILRVLTPLKRRVQLMISRGVVLRSDSSGAIQTLQVKRSNTEVFDDIEHMETYGFTARPHDDAEVVLFASGGLLAHLLALVTPDRRYCIPNLANGEVAMYDDQGNRIVIRRNRIEIIATTHVEVQAPTCRILGAVTIDGDTQINGTLNVSDQISSPTGVDAGGVQLGTHT